MRSFSSRFPQAIILASILIISGPSYLFGQSPTESLKSNFKNPPADSRPMVRWWWFGAAVEKPEILRELQQMKTDGIGGAELAFVYPKSRRPKNLKNLLPSLPPCSTPSTTPQTKAATRPLHRPHLCSGGLTAPPPPRRSCRPPPHREVPIPPTSLVTAPTPEGEAFVSVNVNGEPAEWDAATAQSTPNRRRRFHRRRPSPLQFASLSSSPATAASQARCRGAEGCPDPSATRPSPLISKSR